MDPGTLVGMQIDDGGKLIKELVDSGVDVSCAFWAKTDGDERWYLYIAWSLVDQIGKSQAYRRLHPAIRGLQAQPFWIDPFEVKLISPQSQLAEAAAKIRGDDPGITRFGGTQMGLVRHGEGAHAR